MFAEPFYLAAKKAMKLISTLRICLIILLGVLALSACSTDGYGDGNPESNNNTNSVTTNNQSGSQDNTDPYGTGGNSSESSGAGLEAPDTTLVFDVTNNGASSYVFNNYELENAENPTITLRRGESYTFTIDAPGHPFIIKIVKSASTADSYNEGITNNGVATGTITFEVTEDTPDTLFYSCEFHSSMSGNIIIVD